MSESAESSVIEKLRVDSYSPVETAMTSLTHELGMSPIFIDAVWQQIYGSLERGETPPKTIFFDVDKKSYGYSSEFREIDKSFIPDDAMELIEGENRFFLQVSHSASDTSELRGDAELLMGDDVFIGEEAINNAHEAFPRFFPAQKMPSA